MSFYRFARATAIIALLKRYKASLARALFAAAFALVTSWVYPDIAAFANTQAPHWAGWLLALKTLIIYTALFVVLWELHRAIHDDVSNKPQRRQRQVEAGEPPVKTPAAPTQQPSTLDALVDKPKLKRRKDALLDD